MNLVFGGLIKLICYPHYYLLLNISFLFYFRTSHYICILGLLVLVGYDKYDHIHF